ncbi:MAG: hypothetical protein ACRDHD_07120 [Candidatus Limnocylindria bacterium]
MDEQAVRDHAQAHCDALLAGDIGKAAQELSRELQSNLGPLVAMLPMPLTEAEVESVQMAGTAYRAVLRLAGETQSIRLETRWKERDGRPTIVEASHLKDEAAGEPEPEQSAPG